MNSLLIWHKSQCLLNMESYFQDFRRGVPLDTPDSLKIFPWNLQVEILCQCPTHFYK